MKADNLTDLSMKIIWSRDAERELMNGRFLMSVAENEQN
jgi:hypothetical protein